MTAFANNDEVCPMCVYPKHFGHLDMLRFGARVPAIIAAVVLFAATPALAIGSFSPSLFKFVPIIKDDGKDQGAGWQEATTELNFCDTRPVIPRFWSCIIRVGMPLRPVALGRISPEAAAKMTADLATEASQDVMHRRPDWLTGEFCKAFKGEMNSLFLQEHPDLGAKVNSP